MFPELVKLVASDAAAVDYFGRSLAIDGDTVVVSATGAGTGGAVYVLRASDGEELAKLTASDAAVGDRFGYSVAIDGYRRGRGLRRRRRASPGSAHAFGKSTWGTYDQVAKLTAADAATWDSFGVSVAIDGATIVIGATGR